MEADKKKIDQDTLSEHLVILGYAFPRTEAELLDFDVEYSNYEYKLANFSIDPHSLIEESGCLEVLKKVVSEADTKQKYTFRRIVLAAEIVSQLHSEPTFGHVKFQKLVYLCEQAAEMKLEHLYQKEAAGPYDRRFMHSIDIQLEKQKWFKVINENYCGSSRFKYFPLDKAESYKQYYERYYTTSNDKIQWILNTFRKEKTDQVELIATLYACWTEIISNKEIFSNENLRSKFYKWSIEKSKFPVDRVEVAIDWMKKNDLIPQT